MAKKIKVYSDDINTINNELEKLIEQLNQIYKNIDSNKVLISDSWKSETALKTVAAINAENEKLQDAIKELQSAEQIVKNTTKKILEADNTIKKKLTSIMN